MYSFFIDTIVIVFLGYAISHPLFLWLTPVKKIDTSFYRFNLGLSCIIGSLGVIGYIGIESNFISKIYIWLWISLVLIITAYYWNSKRINNFIITIISILGCFAFFQIIIQISPKSNYLILFFMILLGSMITASVFFSMILGHWYLNVINLPITLLKRSIVVFSLLLVVRTLWDVIYMSIESVTDSYGISYNLWAFTFEFDGFLLGIAMFMGNVVPLILNLFIWKTLKLQATQSATGLIYVSVLSILFGDLLFKYYLLKFGFLL
ncbi:MAG: hypothetical protein HN782_00975 [Candidatus Marinimicrobia bacterium]|nr:hypothetical protein [Candidatus Neomarinimicrobiota bacterium]